MSAINTGCAALVLFMTPGPVFFYGVRSAGEEEDEGLDRTEQGERAYHELF